MLIKEFSVIDTGMKKIRKNHPETMVKPFSFLSVKDREFRHFIERTESNSRHRTEM